MYVDVCSVYTHTCVHIEIDINRYICCGLVNTYGINIISTMIMMITKTILYRHYVFIMSFLFEYYLDVCIYTQISHFQNLMRLRHMF